MSAMFDSFVAMDRALVEHGFPPTSAWWLATIRRFFDSGRRQLVLRVGRRGGKSSTLARLAVLTAVAGDHNVPPGDLGIVAFVSTTRDEAAKRLRTIEAILRALAVGFKPLREGQGFELLDHAVGFQVFSASIAGVSGPTCIAAVCDEVAKWKDADTGANPATEVLNSLRPTLATMPSARIFLSSSPLGPNDAHAKAFDDGDTAFQCIAHAPTWLANPTVTEQQTHDLEPDDRIWRREYAAIPQSAVLAAFDEAAIDRAMIPRAPVSVAAPVLVLDPSSGRKDSWTWGIARQALDERGPFLRFELVDALTGSFWDQVQGDAVVDKLAALCRSNSITEVFADQRESFMLESAFSKRGLRYTAIPWTNPLKVAAVEIVRRWLREGQLALPAHERLRNELLAFEEKITPSGAFTFGGRGAHDDYVALLLTAAMADSDNLIPALGGTYRGTVASIGHASDMRRQVGEAQRTLGLRFTPSPDGTTINAGGVFARSQRAGGTFTKGSSRGGGF